MVVARREWFLRAVIGAIFAIAGFFGQDFYEDYKRNQASDTLLLESVHELRAFLDESYSLFLNQNNQANRLMDMLRENHGGAVPRGVGYDETFFQMYDRFEPSEAELQKLIRSTTMHSLRRVNSEMSAWLAEARELKMQDQPSPERMQLAKELLALELHLNQWHDKYEAFIPGDPKRSLVYLADEKIHGNEFPQGLAGAVNDAITSWQ